MSRYEKGNLSRLSKIVLECAKTLADLRLDKDLWDEGQHFSLRNLLKAVHLDSVRGTVAPYSKNRNWGSQRRNDLQAYFQQFVIYPYNRALLSTWAFVMHSAQTNGRSILCADAWVASVAVLQNIPLVTHNRNDYLGIPGL